MNRHWWPKIEFQIFLIINAKKLRSLTKSTGDTNISLGTGAHTHISTARRCGGSPLLERTSGRLEIQVSFFRCGRCTAIQWGAPQSGRVRHVGCITSGASRRVHHVGCIMLGASCRVHHVGCIMSGASCGVCLHGYIMSGASCRVRHVGCVILGASCRVDLLALSVSSQTHHIQYITMGASCWVFHSGCITLGMSYVSDASSQACHIGYIAGTSRCVHHIRCMTSSCREWRVMLSRHWGTTPKLRRNT